MLTRRHIATASVGLFAAGCTIVTSFRWLDLPLLHLFAGNPGIVQSYGISSFAILSGEFLVAAVLSTMRLARGRLAPSAKALLLASMASICAFVANDYVLKRIFGVPNPGDVLAGRMHMFQFFQGSSMSSFPSGHMALAGAFAGVWIRLYPKTTGLFLALLGIGMAILVIGEWHFLSDVIAGTLLGTAAGLMTGELWLQHLATRPTAGENAHDA